MLQGRMTITAPHFTGVAIVASSLALVAAYAFTDQGGSVVAAQDESCIARTAFGDIVGARSGGGCAFLGIPYAAPPIGNLRWRPPQPPSPWSPAVLNANVAPAACPQINLAGAPAGNENCLALNIWTPSSRPKPLPVLVWLHPGSFVAASANLASDNGQRFAEQRNAVVVAPNYRLGPLGFLAHGALTLEDQSYRSSGNYGLADQRAALRWVREHIVAFGGDPANVTLAGTSAGGISASAHLVSRGSLGLFHRAIVQSGNASTRWQSAFEAEAQGDAFAAAIGCTDPRVVLECLRSKTRDQILTALPLSGLTGGNQQFSQEPGRVAWGPIVDGVEIADQPRELFLRGMLTRVPTIIGSNRDDGWTYVDRSYPGGLDAIQYDRAVRAEFGMDADAVIRTYPLAPFANPKEALARLTTDAEFVCEARRIARAVHREGAVVWVYSLDHSVDPVNPGRAFHGLDRNLVFGNTFGPPSNYVLAGVDLEVSNVMSSFWRRFMETGDPNPRGRPAPWPPYRQHGQFAPPADGSPSDFHYFFEEHHAAGNYLRDSQCNFWEPFLFRSVVGAVPAAAR